MKSRLLLLVLSTLGAAGCRGKVSAGPGPDGGEPTDAGIWSDGGADAGAVTGTTLPPGYPNLDLPPVGTATLRVIAPTLLELTLVTTKAADPAPVTEWNFIDSSGQPSGLPPATDFAVQAAGHPIAVARVGFKRRPLYAPYTAYDLRIGNYLYLELASGVHDGDAVSVDDASHALWTDPTPFTATADPRRYGPAIHVNQVGYLPGYTKKAMVGYYLGSLGELTVPASTFALVDAKTGLQVFTGPLTPRLDTGFNFTPAQYQQVVEADFSSFATPGEYQIQVPGMGASYPFWIDDGVAMAFARTYAQGMYNQRCGMAKTWPFTRFVDGADHLAPAVIPDTSAPYANANSLFGSNAKVPTGQTAPELTNFGVWPATGASLYPYVDTGTRDVSGGHHDAGDYSKYLMDSAFLIHMLVFAADNLPGVGELDNLGIPESGDGKSDVLQEAKWEADFAAKMQDADDGFFYLVYPQTRAYESTVLPSHGDPQLLWPKNTYAAAAAVASLAEIGSSPRFKAQFPTDAARYLQTAKNGWTFLQNALNAHGGEGAYQYIYTDDEFLQDDVLAWAAAALFAATGDVTYQQALEAGFPDPTNKATYRYGWWGMWAGWGNAARTYAFAARSGRLQASQLDGAYLSKCEAEVSAVGADKVTWANHSAYGTSLPDPTKSYGQAGWYFAGTQAFDLAVAYQIDHDPNELSAILSNINYGGGANPVNVSYLSGVGWQRPRELVSQFFHNDRHRLPPSGIDYGAVITGFSYLSLYGSELEELTFPSDGASTAPYGFYDRYSHQFNVATEADTVNEGWGFVAIAAVAGLTTSAATPWTPQGGAIQVPPAQAKVGTPMTVSLNAPAGLDLSRARITWEAADVEPWAGSTSFTFTPRHGGLKWVDAEAVMPDGRRVIGVANDLQVVEDVPASRTIEAFNAGVMLATDSRVAGWYTFDSNLADSRSALPDVALAGNAARDGKSFAWANRPQGAALRVGDLGDQANATFNESALGGSAANAAVSVEAMIYVNALKGYARGNANLLVLYGNYDHFLSLDENEWNGIEVVGGQTFSYTGSDLDGRLTPGQWHHLKILLDATGYTVEIDGATASTFAAAADLAKWSGGTVTLTAGNFDGWIDEIVIKRGE